MPIVTTSLVVGFNEDESADNNAGLKLIVDDRETGPNKGKT